MTDERSRSVIIAGAGIAGLTAAIAFARHGLSVRLYEQAPQLEAFGAGLQLSPNATHILRELGVLPELLPYTVRPRAVELRDAGTLKMLTAIPLGEMAEKRWKAPYLVVHRADLQRALLATANQNTRIELKTGARIVNVHQHANGIEASVNCAGHVSSVSAGLLVGADGVWSAVRNAVRTTAPSRFTGELAWRTTIALDEPAGRAFAGIANTDAVTAFLHSRFHLIAYPISAGTKINLVAFTKGERIADSWSGNADIKILAQAMRNTSPQLRKLVDLAGGWTAWPLHSVDSNGAWTAKGAALIGDAAHAMTPFAAQGAAMAIEDAAMLADFIANDDELATRLSVWEQRRKERVNKVVRRGALNHLAWHAAGPVALARNLFLKLRSPEQLAADLDWLYGWRLPESGSVNDTPSAAVPTDQKSPVKK